MTNNAAETAPAEQTDAPSRVVAVQESLVTIRAGLQDGRRLPLRKNEVIYIEAGRSAAAGHQERLKSEVLRVRGDLADVQVFEDTGGVVVGDPVVQSGEMLSVTLGPGLLGQVYDGLQNPLENIAIQYGTFLPRGVALEALDSRKKWSFVPKVQTGARLRAGGLLGTVQEGAFVHKIMVPFDQQGEVEVTWIQEGSVTVDTPVARIRDAHGHERSLDLTQRWPVRRPLAEHLLRTRVVRAALPAGADDHHHPAGGHLLSRGARGHRLHSRAVRRRQDRAAAAARQACVGRHRDRGRLRRARR